jgi:pyruvate kinase
MSNFNLRRSLWTKKFGAEQVIPALEKLRAKAIAYEHEFKKDLGHIPSSHLESARNLLHYLALRQTDIRSLQQELALLGLSRLGKSEAHVLGSLDALLEAACALAGQPHKHSQTSAAPDIGSGSEFLNRHALELLGKSAEKYNTRIMVTMPGEAAGNPSLVRDLLKAGMNMMRINCAHDDAGAWLEMIRHLRKAEKELGRSCKVYADLAGPKLRTGTIRSVGRVVEIKVKRDLYGILKEPTSVWLTPDDDQVEPATGVGATLPVPRQLLALAEAQDSLVVSDARGVTRILVFKKQYGKSWVALCRQHTYVADSAACKLIRKNEVLCEGVVSSLPEVFRPIVLHAGDELEIIADTKAGAAAKYDKTGKKLLKCASIPCTLPEIFLSAKPGQTVWFDDGKIGGKILTCEKKSIVVKITHALPQGSKLAAEKGINFPQTNIKISALTPVDIDNIGILAPHIDVIGMSFVRTPDDVLALHRQLDKHNASHLGTVLKIETTQAFDNLPMLLLTGLRRPTFGIMVARGDLAVEIGFERLAEVQEEMLWLCEAAHVPVIWATQVLESMAKNGLPSRAEVSDAALSIRAECVMLNKGPYIVETVRFLADVLERMAGHLNKRSQMMRQLSVSHITNHEE